MKISYVIPSFNEKESLLELLTRIKKVNEQTNWDAEIIIVDDGSTDKSFELLNKLRTDFTNLHAIQFRKNSGKAAALSAGFQRSKGDYIVMMDADLQDEPNDVPQLIKKLEDGYDAVTGWKVDRHDPWHKVIPSRIINWVVRRMYSITLHDMNCGLKAFRRDVVLDLPLYGDLYRYILLFAHAKGFKVTELPTTHHSRKFGVSKYGVSRFFKGFTDLFTVYFLTRYGKRPLHFFGAAGFILGFFGSAILVYLTILKISGEPIGDRPLLLLGVLLLLLGLQLFATGFVAELIISQRSNDLPPIKEDF